MLDLDGLRREIADLGEQITAPDLWDDQANATRVTGRLSGLQGELDRFSDLESRIGDLGALVELGHEEDDAASMAEAEAELTKIKKSVEALEVRTLLSGEYDARDAVITVRSGAGGVDAADFTEMLMRMYVRWAEQHKYPVEVFDTSYAEEAGLKSATFAIRAPYAYGTLSVEAGTHRLVRISPFDNRAAARRRSRPSRWCRCSSRPTRSRSRRGHPRRRLPLVRSWRPVGEHHRLGRPSDPHPHRHGGLLPEREVPAAEQGLGDGDPQGPAAGDEEDQGRRAQGAPGDVTATWATRCATTC